MEPILLLEEGLKKLNITTTEVQRHQILRYLQLLLAWNEKVNLTAITDIRQMIIYHVLDSISLLTVINIPEDARILDVGTGAGFPGIPLKILRPALRLVLMDSVRKKTTFLEAAAAAVSIQTIEVIHGRAEEAGRQPPLREAFDGVVSRAVAGLPALSEYCLPFVKLGGWFAAYKGPGAQEEAAAAAGALDTLGGSKPEIHRIQVPFSEKIHQILVVEKKRPTPRQYPRAGDKPRKAPLQHAKGR